MRMADQAILKGIGHPDGEMENWNRLVRSQLAGDATYIRRVIASHGEVPVDAPSPSDVRIPVVVADNVHQWAVNQYDVTLEEIPCLSPPWQKVWIEYPSVSGNERRGTLCSDLTWLLEHPEDIESFPPGPWTAIISGCLDDAEEKEPDVPVAQLLGMQIYIASGHSDKVIGPLGALMFALSKRGKVLGNRWMVTIENPKGPLGEAGPQVLLAMANTAIWTIALSHVRNTTLLPQRVDPKLARRYRKRHGLEPVRYHVLRLQLPRSSSGSGATGDFESPGLHIVVGHFAHFGDCCDTHPPRGKLFGRLEGVYWIPQHLRGTSTEGNVITDYEVTKAR